MPAADLSSPAADMAVAAGPDLAGPQLSFFITSEAGSGDLGGLVGADARCQRLATAVGAGNKKWAAYLSVSAMGTQVAVNARDRIGQGPWYNKNLEKVADNVAGLHPDMGNVNGTTGIDEKGQAVPTNRHDILTGSTANGMVNGTFNCANWTSSATSGVKATVGHFNRAGGGAAPTSGNAAHESNDCSAAGLVATGGEGRFYCFATN